jgi:hypothetical protein
MSAPGQAGGDAGTTGNGDAGNGEAQGQGQGPDLSRMVDQIGQIASGQEEMRQYLASNPWTPQDAEPQQEGTPDEGLDLSWLDPQATAYDDPQAVADRLNTQINGAVDQRAQKLMAPMAEQMAEMRRDQQARDLAAEFPEIATDEMANKIAGPGGLAAQMADQLGQPGLAAEPGFWRLVYMAHRAAESGNQDGSDGPAATLEAGGGPGPAAQTNEDIVKGIMEAGGRGSKVLDFRT